MRRRLPCVTALLASLLSHGVTPAAEEKTLALGRRVYDREGCAMCHSIAGTGKRRHPLDGVGARLKREDIRKWIVSPREMNPEVRKKAYQLSQEDLDALIEYLSSLEQ